MTLEEAKRIAHDYIKYDITGDPYDYKNALILLTEAATRIQQVRNGKYLSFRAPLPGETLD